jgi:hypothetical protein
LKLGKIYEVKIFYSTFIQNTICVVYLGIVERGGVEGLHAEEIGGLNIL